MDNLRNIRLEVRRDGFVEPRGEDEPVGAWRVRVKRDCFVSLRADIVMPPRTVGADEGLREVDFFFTREQFEEWGSGRSFQLRDLYRCADSWGGDVVLFSRQDALHDGRMTSGVASVPYYNASIPAFVRKWMLRVAERAWDHPASLGASEHDARDRPQVTIELSDARRERMGRLYGQGLGIVDVDACEETRACIEKWQAEKSFADQFDRVQRIAKNTTRGFHERAKVRIHRETWGRQASGSFGWAAYTPRRRCTMNGGLIFHRNRDAADDAPIGDAAGSWSVHT